MKYATPAALVLVTAAVAWFGFAWRPAAQPPAPSVSFEYEVVPLMYVAGGYEGDLRRLNELGAFGWEVVGVATDIPTGNPPGPAAPRVILKRAKR